MNYAECRGIPGCSALDSRSCAAVPGQTASPEADISLRAHLNCRHPVRRPEYRRLLPYRKATCRLWDCRGPSVGARIGRLSCLAGGLGQHSQKGAPQAPERGSISTLNQPVFQRGPIVRAACIQRWAQVFHEPHTLISYGHAVQVNRQSERALSRLDLHEVLVPAFL